MKRYLNLTWLVGVALCLMVGLGHAASCGEGDAGGCVVVTGEAPLEQDTPAARIYARQMALRQALVAATQRCHVQVQGFESARDFTLQRSEVSIRSSAAVKGFTVLKEEADREEGIYRIRVRACLQPVTQQCPVPLAATYQPRIAVAAVQVLHPEQTRDLRDLRTGWQQALTDALRQRGWHNVSLWMQGGQLMPGMTVTPNLDPQLLAQWYEDTGARYLLLTLIRDMGMDLAAPQDALGRMMGQVRRYYSMDASPRYRSLAVEWWIVDALSGRIVKHDQLRRHVEGEVTVGRDRPFGGAAFAETATGRALLAMVSQQAARVRQALQCAPWAGEILEVQHLPDERIPSEPSKEADAGEENEAETEKRTAPAPIRQRTRIVFFAHAESGLRPGDVVTIYHRSDRPVRRAGAVLGWRSEPIGFARVEEVSDRFAVAEVIGEKQPVQVGDRVQGW